MGSSSDLITINQKKMISELLSFKGFFQAAIDLLNARDDLFNLDEVHYQTDLFAKGMGKLQGSEDEMKRKYQADFWVHIAGARIN
jgi:hypothetical protein